MTRMLVRRHRVLIERVAKALLERETINGKQLDEMIGRSVDDVKVNAPWILQMHQQALIGG
jgi:ATP-dependent Zn protease